jgi:hypothetical protein
MEDATKTKPEIWDETMRVRTRCPFCNRSVTIRTLRWKHKCRPKPLPVLLDQQGAARRRQEIERKAFEALQQRLKGGPDDLRGK